MNDRKRTAENGGAAVFSVRLSALCYLTSIFRFSLSETGIRGSANRGIIGLEAKRTRV
jgi:hypothetical protein